MIIFYFFLIFNKSGLYQVDLNNYLDKIYGEDDLIEVIKEKEIELINSSSKKRNEIEKEIKNIYNVIEKIKEKKRETINKIKK